jgi:hypothetical protein
MPGLWYQDETGAWIQEGTGVRTQYVGKSAGKGKGDMFGTYTGSRIIGEENPGKGT